MVSVALNLTTMQIISITYNVYIICRYARYAHSLNALKKDGLDVMILAGGYASSPSNDLWVTEDGSHWM